MLVCCVWFHKNGAARLNNAFIVGFETTRVERSDLRVEHDDPKTHLSSVLSSGYYGM